MNRAPGINGGEIARVVGGLIAGPGVMATLLGDPCKQVAIPASARVF